MVRSWQPYMYMHARIQKVLSEGVQGLNFGNFFLVDEGMEDTNVTINGPSWSRQRNANLMAFRWRTDDDPTLNAGLVAL